MDTVTPLQYVKGIGPARAEMLEAKGLVTVEDLLAYAPFRYEDRTNVKTIAQLAPGEMATVIAEVQSAHLADSAAAIWDCSRRFSRMPPASGCWRNGFTADIWWIAFCRACAWRCTARWNSTTTPATC